MGRGWCDSQGTRKEWGLNSEHSSSSDNESARPPASTLAILSVKPRVFQMLIVCSFPTALSRLVYVGREQNLRCSHPCQILLKIGWDAVLLLQRLSKSLCRTVSMPCMRRCCVEATGLLSLFKQGCGLPYALEFWMVILFPIFSPMQCQFVWQNHHILRLLHLRISSTSFKLNSA